MPNPAAVRRLAYTVTVAMMLLAIAQTAVAADPPPTPLTFADRVAAHLALEEVMASHRTGDGSGVEVAFDEAAARRRAERSADATLRMSAALERRYGVRFSGAELQAELDRMARTSLDPGRLAEYFEALDDDPRRAAECLARPVLAENRLRERYAWDERIHATLRADAQRAWSRASVDGLRAVGGRYSESEWVRVSDPRTVAGAEPEPIDGPTYLDDEGWQRLQAKLRRDLGLDDGTVIPRAGTLGALQETAERLVGTALLDATHDRVRLARVVWRKQDFHTWWAREGTRHQAEIIEPAHAYRLPDPVAMRAKATAGGDRWQAVTSVGAPSVRSDHEAVWTGSEMVVWGGWAGNSSDFFATGGVYDPATNSWTATGTSGAPAGRRRFAAVAPGVYGFEMAVWGGYGGSNFSTGAMYDVGTGGWTSTCSTSGSPCYVPDGRRDHTMIAGGREASVFTVWGGLNSNGPLDDGAGFAYYGAGDGGWYATDTSDPHQPDARYEHTAVRATDSGRDTMMVWGGHGDGTAERLDTGALFALDDLDSDLWTPVTSVGVPPGRERHAAVALDRDHDVFGDEETVVIWGGYTWGLDLWSAQGGAYDVVDDAWTLLSTAGAPAGRQNLRMVWTGHEVIVWGGDQTSSCTDTGGRYGPFSDSWSLTDTTDLDTPSARTDHTAVWTGKGMIVWGGYDLTDRLRDGAMYRSCYAATDAAGADVWAEDASCTASGITVSWSQDPTEWGDYDPSLREYWVFRDGSPIASGGCASPLPYGTTSCTDDTVTSGTEYSYTVMYRNGCWNDATTPEAATATDLDGSDPVVTVTATVEDLDPCNFAGGFGIEWPSAPGGGWGDNGVGERWYRVWRRTNGGAWEAIGERTDRTWYDDASTVPGWQYEYKVRYINGCDLWTATASEGGQDLLGQQPTVSQAAAAVDANACEHTGNRISWPQDPDSWGDHDGGDGERTFRVYRSSDGSSWTPIGTELGSWVTSYLDTTATPDETYFYRVRYTNGCGISADSAAGTAADLAASAPSGVPAAAAADEDACDGTGIRVSWAQDPGDWGDGATGTRSYDVLRDGEPVATGLGYPSYGHVDESVISGTEYLYRVRYVNGCGLSTTTVGGSAVDLPTAPTAPAGNSTAQDVNACSYSGVRVTWDADPASGWGDAGEAGGHTYEVLRDGVVVATGIAYGTTGWVDDTGAAGVPYEYTVRYVNCGDLTVETAGATAADEGIPGGVFCDGFETGDTTGWDGSSRVGDPAEAGARAHAPARPPAGEGGSLS